MRLPFNGEYKRTQGFGENPSMYAKYGFKGHNGIDYGLPTNTQVVASHSGKVVEARFDPSGYGNYIKIENDKEGSILAHLNSFQVKEGDTVSEGQPLALSGNTGYSTGPHLHWGYYTHPRNRQNGYGGFIDQAGLIKPTPGLQAQLDLAIKQRNSKHDTLIRLCDALGVTVDPESDGGTADRAIARINELRDLPEGYKKRLSQIKDLASV